MEEMRTARHSSHSFLRGLRQGLELTVVSQSNMKNARGHFLNARFQTGVVLIIPIAIDEVNGESGMIRRRRKGAGGGGGELSLIPK